MHILALIHIRLGLACLCRFGAASPRGFLRLVIIKVKADDFVASLDYGLRSDAMFFIVCELQCASAACLVDGLLHRVGDFVGIHDDRAVEVTCCASHGLCQRAVGAQESLFVGIEDGHERHFGQVESLTEQVDTDEYVKCAVTQPVDNLYAVESVYIAVYVGRFHAQFQQIVVEFFSHPFGQSGDEYPFASLYAQVDFFEEVVYLVE